MGVGEHFRVSEDNTPGTGAWKQKVHVGLKLRKLWRTKNTEVLKAPVASRHSGPLCPTTQAETLSSAGSGWGVSQVITGSSRCDRSVCTMGRDGRAGVSWWGTRLPQDTNRPGEVPALCQEEPADTGTCRGRGDQGSEPHCVDFITISSGGERIYRRKNGAGNKPHKFYFDFITRLLEITDRLNEIIRFGAAENLKVEI